MVTGQIIVTINKCKLLVVLFYFGNVIYLVVVNVLVVSNSSLKYNTAAFLYFI